VSVDARELAACAAGSLALALVVFAVLERRSRHRWSTSPLATRVVGDAYRASSIVSVYRTRAPASVRFVAASCIVFACVTIPSAVSTWLAFERYGGCVECAGVASMAMAYAGGALLARSNRADETTRVIAATCACFFTVLCVAALSHARGAPGCARFGPGVFSIEAAAFGIAAAFAPLCAWLLVVQRRHPVVFRAPA
jgi:hypothetical protein